MKKQFNKGIFKEMEKNATYFFNKQGLKSLCSYMKDRAGEAKKFSYPSKERVLELYDAADRLFPYKQCVYFISDIMSVIEIESFLIIFGCIEKEKTESEYTITLLDNFFELCKELGIKIA